MGEVDGKSEIRTRRRLLRRIRPHLKEEAMSRPQATVRRVGRRPTANPKSISEGDGFHFDLNAERERDDLHRGTRRRVRGEEFRIDAVHRLEVP